MITYIKEFLDPKLVKCDGVTIIPHVANNIGVMGAGFARTLRIAYPKIYSDYRRSKMLLGNNVYSYVGDNKLVVSMIAQRGLFSKNNPVPLQMEALSACLDNLRLIMLLIAGHKEVHAPRFGAGLARGNWNDIEPLLKKFQDDVFIYGK